MSDDPLAEPPQRVPRDYFLIPSPARMWDYFLGGRDNYEVDRSAGDAVIRRYPGIVRVARQSRLFGARAIRFLAAEAGLRQFLDIGTGLPNMQNTHEVAQRVAPESTVVYVDNDPVVLAYARAMLVSPKKLGRIGYVLADVREPERILREAAEYLSFDRPIAVILSGVLGYVPEFDVVRSVVTRLLNAVVSGSYLLLRDGVDTITESRKALTTFTQDYPKATSYNLRTIEQLTELLTGVELVEPGLVPVTKWRPERAGDEPDLPIDAYAAVGRKA